MGKNRNTHLLQYESKNIGGAAFYSIIGIIYLEYTEYLGFTTVVPLSILEIELKYFFFIICPTIRKYKLLDLERYQFIVPSCRTILHK
jgi:hypothetical protein